MNMDESKSKKPDHDTGDLVATPSGNVGEVSPASQYEGMEGHEYIHYQVKCGGRKGTFVDHVYGEKLRLVNRWEWWWHRNPNTGTFQVGRTNWYEWIGQMLASLFVMWAAFAWLDAREMDERIGRYILLLIGTARILTLIKGVEDNYQLNGKRP